MEILFGIAIFVLIMASLCVLNEVFHIIKCFKDLKQYKLNNLKTLALWSSISYIITFIIMTV